MQENTMLYYYDAKLQPLDVAFMRPLSTSYRAEINKRLRARPYEVEKLFAKPQQMLTEITNTERIVSTDDPNAINNH